MDAPCPPTSRCRPRCPAIPQGYAGYPTIPKAPRSCWPRPASADGFETELYVMNTDPNPRIAQAIQQDLAAIGIKANDPVACPGQRDRGRRRRNGAPMIWSGGMAWIADFPDPSNFYGPILGCAGRGSRAAGTGPSSATRRSTPRPPRRTACSIPAKAEPTASRLWSDVYVGVMEQAPWVPVFNEERYTMKSARMGGEDNAITSIRSRSRSTTTTSGQTVSAMCKACDYTIHGAQHHFGWDNTLAPRRAGRPWIDDLLPLPRLFGGPAWPVGSTVWPTWSTLDFGKINPVSGPIYVEGAKPGDVLKVTIEEFAPQLSRRRGLRLDGQHSRLRAARRPVHRPRAAASGPMIPGQHGARGFGDAGAKVPLKPFAGTIGNAPAEAGQHSVVPPRRVGGNLDIRDLTSGVTLYLPVEVDGRPLQRGRHPCRTGRRRGLRHGHRVAL